MRHIYGLALFALWTMGGCGGASAPTDDGELKIVATLAPLAWPAEYLYPDQATVSVLIPAGGSPHGFEPSPSDLVALREADLIFMVGDIDSWVVETLPENDERVVWMQDPNSPVQRRFVGGSHPWLNFEQAHRFTTSASTGLMFIEGGDPVALAGTLADAWRPAYEAYAGFVEKLQANDLLVITGHDAWGAFFDETAAEVVATHDGHHHETSPTHLASIRQRALAAKRVLVVLEPAHDDPWLEALAEEVGAATVTLDPVGTRDWPGDMKKRYEAVEAALESLE